MKPSKSKKALRLSQVYRLLEPGPVVLVTTSRKGKSNIMAMSWHTMMEFEPPIVGCVISNRNYSFETLKEAKECVINIPTMALAKKVVRCGNTSGGGSINSVPSGLLLFRPRKFRRRLSANAMRIWNAGSSIQDWWKSIIFLS